MHLAIYIDSNRTVPEKTRDISSVTMSSGYCEMDKLLNILFCVSRHSIQTVFFIKEHFEVLLESNISNRYVRNSYNHSELYFVVLHSFENSIRYIYSTVNRNYQTIKSSNNVCI